MRVTIVLALTSGLNIVACAWLLGVAFVNRITPCNSDTRCKSIFQGRCDQACS